MNVLVPNAGSSTLKFELIRTDPELMRGDEDLKLASGTVERVGGDAILELVVADGPAHLETAGRRDTASTAPRTDT